MNILVTGANGQLGSEIQELSQNNTLNTFFFEGSQTLDITSYNILHDYVHDHNIKAVINCAAYTAVDKAEEEPEKARLTNVNGVENLIRALQAVQGKLVHLSTDYVFDGRSVEPYCEEDTVNPLGTYGQTKRMGEDKVIHSPIESVAIRTSWLYSSYGHNFLKTMMRLGRENDTLSVVFDQIASPTYARDLAQVCLQMITSKEPLDSKSKLYHYANEGVASWYDFAKAIMEIANINCMIKPIETKDYPTVAQRPKFSLLNKQKIKNDFNIEIPYWRDSLQECIHKKLNQ